MKPKRVLIFSVAYLPFVGGAEIAVKEITDRINASEYNFDLITVNLSGKERAFEKLNNVTVYRIGSGKLGKILFPFLALGKASRLHFSHSYQAIWAIMANYAGFAGLFFKLLHPKVPFILTLQEGDPIGYIKKRVGIFYPLFKMIFRRADHIQAISNYLADWAKTMGANNLVTIVPNGVDVSHFSRNYLPEELSATMLKLGKKDGDTFLITTSRLVLKNGVGDIIKALQFLPEQVKLLVVGNGPLEESLKSQAISLKLEERIRFLGFIFHEELPKYLRVSDIFIRPSLSEGLGNSFIEAMAAGLPVVATPVGGIPDFLENKETGLFCEVSNPEDIARKINILMRDKEIRDYVVTNGRKLVAENYDWSLVATQIKSIFDNLNEKI